MNTPTINKTFKSLIPPLADAELAQLEGNIVRDGCRDALVTWNGVLLDGHNRLDICTRHGLPFQTVSVDLDDELDAQLWICRNQKGRRNLTEDQRAMLSQKQVELESKLAKRDRAKKAVTAREVKAGREEPILLVTSSSKIDSGSHPSTRAAVAKRDRVSERKIRQAQIVAKADPALADQVKNGATSLADACREIKKRTVVANLESVATVEAKAASGIYDVIVCDPPWPMEKIERDCCPNQVAFDYPTMTEDQLRALTIPAAFDCHFWLWTTHRFLPMALGLLDAWSLKYVCTFVWHKPGGFQPFGLPQYNCEFALYARSGSPQFIDTKAFPVCFSAPRGAHSEKPDAFYDIVRRVTAGRRLDMFNRRKIEGFDGWGKEAAE